MTSRKTMDLLNGSIWDKILMFALPLALTGILQQLFNASNVAVIGTFVGKESMAAVGSNAPIIGLIINLFVGISVGANVVISRYIGQHNEEKISRAVHTTIVLALLSGLIVAALGNLIAEPLIHLLGVPEEIQGLALRYLRIYFLGSPFAMLYNFEAAIFRSRGDTRTPLLCLVISGVVNVALNVFFVLACHMDVEGAALALLLANLLSASLLLHFLRRQTGPLRFELAKCRLDRCILSSILRIGVPSGLQGIVFSISNLVVQSAINSVGADAMAGSSAAFNLEFMEYYVVNAFGQACVTFIGQNYGVGNRRRCGEIVKQALLLNWGATILISIVMLVFGRQLLGLFNDDPQVIEFGYTRMKYLLTAEVINAIMETLSGAMRGYGHSLRPAIIVFVGVCGVRIAWVYTIFAQIHTWDCLMAVYPISWVVTASILILEFRHLTRRILPKEKTPA